MALRLVSALFLAGQASTHRPQPVQSSGATWRVYAAPGNSFQRAGEVPKPSGGAESSVGSKTFARITACGHTSTHLLHWIHTDGSHSGISTAMLRFSQRVVPLGYVPSTGSALTGSKSPWPAIMGPVTLVTNSGAPSATVWRSSRVLVTMDGTTTSCRCARAASTATKL